MQLYSTNNPNLRVNFEQALFEGLPTDNGLFMPLLIPALPNSFFRDLPNLSFPETAFRVAQNLLQGAIPNDDLHRIINEAINFPAPLVTLSDREHVLELFHGPSLAFKDFGARFMAGCMAHFRKRDLCILVATSGDTGGAVAAGFFNTPGIRVVILYPSGKVSVLQEKQLTTLGHNIQALEVQGSFDDCQTLVKQAFLDQELRSAIELSSANSINIARLIPQSFYYFEAYRQLPNKQTHLAFSIPSGNFGNLTAGLLAKRMGLPIKNLIAATNTNDVVPAYLHSGNYKTQPSKTTLSNAMDVGNPSNFARMKDLYGSTWNIMRDEIKGYAFNDAQTEDAMQQVEKQFNYVMDPHTAIGHLALQSYLQDYPNHQGVVLSTAHPAKFLPDVERILGHSIEVPNRLAELKHLPKQSVVMEVNYSTFKTWLLNNIKH
ncbi:MAG: threonine synthase [Saprospiraceae bacterium]|nr:threonine synthase [Saprospiraceae bacterium]